MTDEEAFKNLEELHLSDNHINDFMVSKGLPKLEVLDLDWNNLRGSILSSLSGLPTLKQLRLSSTNLTGLIQLRDIEAMKNLEELDLSYNNINGFMDYAGCGQAQELRILNLDSNGLENHPPCLGHLTSLQKLDLSFNHFVGDIPSSLQSLTGLQTVYLSYNYFSGEIPSWLGNLTALQNLDLTSNHFMGNIASSPLICLFLLKSFNYRTITSKSLIHLNHLRTTPS